MERQVTFESDYFAPEPGEDQATNPGRYGHALALWLQEQLHARGVTTEAVLAEDFGWIVMVSSKPCRLHLACGNIEGSMTQWSIFPAVDASLWQRLTRGAEIEHVMERLWDHVKAIIPTVPRIDNVEWA